LGLPVLSASRLWWLDTVCAMNVNGPEFHKDADLINRNPTVWQSSGVAYGFLRVIATNYDEVDGFYQVFAGLGLGALPDYYKIIRAETIDEAITFIQNWDNQMYDEIMAG
jgi:hypothetical protein